MSPKKEMTDDADAVMACGRCGSTSAEDGELVAEHENKVLLKVELHCKCGFVTTIERSNEFVA